ncbi:MAG: hypothetical protein K2N26_08325, partial [Oscillospiraceae bacterium]|nr:hypothetical protein [Oscillospiraceae bacterium]
MTKKKKVHILCIILPIIAIIVAAITYLNVRSVILTKTWRTFSEKRVEKLEEVFNVDFPDNAEFEIYSIEFKFFCDYFRIRGGDYTHTLYVKNISDPEDFCRNNFGTSVSFTFMADLKYAEVLENTLFSEKGVELFFKKDTKNWLFKNYNENWLKEERSVDFFGHAINKISEDTWYTVYYTHL